MLFLTDEIQPFVTDRLFFKRGSSSGVIRYKSTAIIKHEG